MLLETVYINLQVSTLFYIDILIQNLNVVELFTFQAQSHENVQS